MSELLQAAKAVIEELNSGMPHDGVSEEAEDALRAAVERAEKQETVRLSDDEIRELFLSNGFTIKDGCSDLKPYVFQAARAIEFAAQQAERERIRARVKLAAEKTWKAGDWYVGPQHNNIEAFVEELLRDDDEQP